MQVDAFEYTTVRNVPATNDRGDQAFICMTIIRWPNGHTEHLAINEDMIAYRVNGNPDPEAQEAVIAEEVRAFVTRH